jgi:hypothetical protein
MKTKGDAVKLWVLRIAVLAIGISLGGCMFTPKEHFYQNTTRYAPMAEDITTPQKEELKAQALADPVTKEIRAKLETRGYMLLEDPVVMLQYERGFLVIFRAIVPPNDRTPTSVSGLAHLIYIGLHQGSRAFGVVDHGEKTLHIYPDGEKAFRGAGDVLHQLRKNERFRKFEQWLQTHGKVVGAAGAVLDETSYDIHIIVATAPPASHNSGQVGVMALDPNVEVYVALAKALAVKDDEVLLDLETLVLLPSTKTERDFGPGFPVRDVNPGVKLVGGPVYTIISGGEKPRAFPNLRDFAFYTRRDTGEHLTGDTGQGGFSQFVPAAQTRRGSLPFPKIPLQEERSLTVFCWDLINVPADNILLQFKTYAELTIEAYNLAVQYGLPITLGAAHAQKEIKLAFLGFSQQSFADVQVHYEKACELTESDYFVVPALGMVGIFEDLLAMSFSDLGLLLLRLAEGDEQGKFEETYEALRPHGLEALERLFARFELKPTPERRITFIQALARQWKKYLQETQPKLAPQVFKEIFITWTATILLDYLYNTLFAYVSFKERPQYVRAWVEGVGEGAVIKFKKRPTIEEATFTGINIVILMDLMTEWIDLTSTENFLPPFPGVEDRQNLARVWREYVKSLLGRAARLDPPPNALAYAALVACYQEVIWMTVPERHRRTAIVNNLRHLLRLGVHLGAAEREGWVSEGAWVAGLTEVRVVYRRDKGLLPDPYEKANQVDPKQPIHHRPVVDVAIVNYANEPKHELLDWASKTLNEVRKDPEWPNCKGAWGLNVVAVVITERLDAEKVKEFLVKLKDHPLLTRIARNIRKRAASDSAYISTAFVAAWRSEGSNHVNYVWIDYGPYETPVVLRQETVKAIAAVQPGEILVEISEEVVKGTSITFSNEPIILAGGYGLEAREHQTIFPIWIDGQK